MKHWERFYEMAMTQMMAVSTSLDAATFQTWCIDCAAQKRETRKVLVFFEKGRDAASIEKFKKIVNIYLLGRELEVVLDVSSAEIQKMIKLANEINGDS